MNCMNAVDTNILIYACDARDAGRQQRAVELIAQLADGVLLWQVACEFVAASRKLAPYGFSPEAAWGRLETLLRVFPLALPSAEVFARARELHTVRQVAFWDAMLLAACMEAGVGKLYSEDVPGAAVTGVEV